MIVGMSYMTVVVKRTFDFISAMLLFVAISPLFIVICVLVKVQSGSPIFFKQIRSGKNHKKFSIIKFRTMSDLRDEKGNLLPDELRLTKFGNWLRSTSLDELPQLLNIIAGDMSVIGPRPLPPEYDDFYLEQEEARFLVRGGLIQPEVLHDTILPTWNEQLKWEADYASNLSLIYDVKIFFAVFKTLMKRNKNEYGSYIRPSLIQERSKERIK